MAATRVGLGKIELDTAWPRVSELPFDSERKRMTTVHQVSAASDPAFRVWESSAAQMRTPRFLHCFVKGAVDGLVERSSHTVVEGSGHAING